MEAITLPVYNTEGKEVETIKLDASVFDGEVNSAAIHQAVIAYRANQRKGLAETKTRGEVSGGGRKPWKQKGTGRARVGSIRSPLWRHGGVIFGPHPRDFSYQLPQKIRSVALKSSLNAKVKENNLVVLDSLEAKAPKTKEMNKVFLNLKVTPPKNKNSRVLLLSDNLDNNLRLSLRNLKFLDLNLSRDTHVYEVLSARKLVITKSGLAQLVKRLKQ